MITKFQLAQSGLRKAEITDAGILLQSAVGNEVFLTHEMLALLVEEAKTELVEKDWQVYMTDTDGSERKAGVVQATSYGDAYAKAMAAGMDPTDVVLKK